MASALGRVSLALCAILLLAGSIVSAHAQTIPVATAITSTQVVPAISGGTNRIAANSLGDLFYVGVGANTLYWLPRNATTPIALVTGLSGARNAYVDANNNVYVPSTYGGFIVEIPYVGGTYATSGSASSLGACSGFAPTSPCQQGSATSVLGYYYQPLDVGMDAAGNLYAIDSYSNGQCTADCLVEFTRGTTTYNAPTVIKSGITSGSNTNLQLAIAPNGDAYYSTGTSSAAGGTVYYIATGTSTPVAVGSFTGPSGVASDKYGNIYVTNSQSPNGIFEFPAVGGVAQPSKVFAFFSTYSGNGVAFDGLGDMYYTGYSGGVTVNLAQINGIPLGSAAVGTPVSATPANITFTFSGGGTSASTTIGAITSNGNGYTYTAGSCAAGTTYASGSSCTVNVNLTPAAVGLQRGAVSLTTAAGANLATALLSGIGQGAAETNDPGTITTIGSGFTSPVDVRVDGSGNVYVADSGQNAVLRYAGGTGTPTSIGTGLSKPSSLAIDGAGNVYIADAGNGRVVEVPNLNGTLTNSAQTVIASGLGTTLSIALDRYGNLYIADGAKTTITKLANLAGVPSSALTSTVGSGFKLPFALAVDFNGNLFVADYTANTVSEIGFYGQTQTSVGAGFTKPTGLVTDASGSLYVADSGNKRLLKIPLEGTSFNTNDQYVVSPTGVTPYSAGIDSVGNLYYTDLTASSVSESNRTAGTLSLGRAQINTTTAASNAQIGNAGNTSLTLGTPAYTAISTTPTYFTVTSPTTNGCANGGTIAPGFACVLSATFSPTTTGTFSDLLTFSSNAVNSATKALNITGRGLNLAVTTTTLTQTSPAGTASFGQAVTIQAKISSAVTGTPTGTVTFSVDGNVQSNTPTVTNGVASITLTGLTGGNHTVTASYTGDDNFAPSNSSLLVTVAQASASTTLMITTNPQSANPVSAAPGAPVTLMATIAPSTSTPPTGTVTFTQGSTALNPTPIPLSSTYTASLTLTTLPTGTDTIRATYSGDVNYAASFGSAVVIISPATFTLTPSTATITLSSGQTGSTNLTVTSISNFAGAKTSGTYVGLSCSGLPANSSCAFSPNGFYFYQDNPQTVLLQIVTGQTPVVAQPVTGGMIGGAGHSALTRIALLMLALAPLAFWARRRASGRLLRSSLALSILLLIGGAASCISGCGGGSQLFGVTPSGTYQITVNALSTGSSGSVKQTSTVTLVVK